MQPNTKRAGRSQTLEKNPIVSVTNSKAMATSAKPLGPEYMALVQLVHDTKDHNVLRLPATAKKMGRATSTIWQDVKSGALTPPIRLGLRAVGWLQAEVDAILAARALSSRASMPLNINLFVSLLVAPRLASKECTEATDGVENV
jgi:prophage regulatory protein